VTNEREGVLTHLDAFSGIGGWGYAARLCGGIQTVQFIENDPFCQRVLHKNFPEAKIDGDVKEFSGHQYRGGVNIFTASPPCQPVSRAGKRRGKEDDRYLWGETLRVIDEINPDWVILENPFDFITMGLDETLFALANLNYEVQSFIIPACAVQAFHRRDRVWIVGNSIGKHRTKHVTGNKLEVENQEGSDRRYVHDPRWEQNWIEVATGFCGDDDGLPRPMDINRLKALGNSIVPQIAEQFFRAIVQIESAL